MRDNNKLLRHLPQF